MSTTAPRSVLFLCVANSARSQMAEGWGKALLGGDFLVRSAGSAPSRVNPWAIAAMKEVGISLEEHHSKSVSAISTDSVDLVVTLCAEEECPVFLSDAPRLDWSLPDPDRKHEELTEEQRLHFFRIARDKIRKRVELLSELLQRAEGCSLQELQAIHSCLLAEESAA